MPTLNLTWYQLEVLGLVFCACGHRTNNHFDHGKKTCAHCKCNQLKREIKLPPRSKPAPVGHT